MSPLRDPAWTHVVLHPGVLREPTCEGNRLVLWLPEERGGGFLYWQRIGTVSHVPITVYQDLSALPATALRARQRVRGVLGKLLGWSRRVPSEGTWVLPNGDVAHQCGERQTDLLLAWAEDSSAGIEELRLRERLPPCQRLQALGPRLWLLWGVAARPAAAELEAADPQEQAERRVAAARQAGDGAGEVTALTDLGLLVLNRGEVGRARAALEGALALARDLGDRAREADVLGNLALTYQASGQPRRAQPLLEQELALVRDLADPFAEKLALEHLSLVLVAQGDIVAAVPLLHQAAALARLVGDRQHESALLWHLAIRQAERGDRSQALVHAQAAVDLLHLLGKPQAAVYAEHLQKYRHADPSAALAGPPGSRSSVPAAPAGPGPQGGSPSLLRMAISASRALTDFIGSGLQTVAPSVHQERRRICAACPHHTGLRCRVCGCFTHLKVHLPHERCPISKWPACPS